ncbi:MAG: hypothetical protein LBL37_03500 [Gracilibacteraceae bacterium]|jgi:hypothetical protein|nr:hypothetical protein [Gracilibacteraceae bacterium]
MNGIDLTPAEKERAIENILDRGLRKPRSFWAALREIRRLLGYRFVFWDTAQALVSSVITLAGVALFIALSPAALRHTVLFGCSPLLFMVVMLFAETMECAGGLYELKLTCRYTIRQITALRILCFSLLGIAFCAGVTACQAKNMHEVLRLFPLSLCALFICAFISLFLIRRLAGKQTYALAAALWAAIACLPAFLFGKKWESFLLDLPAVVTAGAALLAAALFLLEIKKFTRARREEAAPYAVG